jgi:hypothetical protein
LFFWFLFLATAPWIQAQTVGHPVMVFSPHIQAPVVVHVPHLSQAQVRSFANNNTAGFRSLYNPLGNNPIVNPPGINPASAPNPLGNNPIVNSPGINRVPHIALQKVAPERNVPLGTTVETETRTAVNGYTVTQVRQVQAALHRLGYYNGQVDGDFGPITQNALERYQLSAGEPVTGTLTLGVLGRLGVSPNR